MTILRQVGINVLTKWISFFLRAIVGIALVPFLIRELGTEYYGLSILLGSIVGFTAIADVGLRGALGRDLSEALSRKEDRLFNQLASTAGTIWLGIGASLAIICSVLAPSIIKYLNVSAEIADEAIFLVMTFGSGSILLSFIQPLMTAIISSHNRFDILNKVEAVFFLISALCLFLLIGVADLGIFAWASIMMCSRLSIVCFLGLRTKNLVPCLDLSFRNFDLSSLKRLFSLSSYLFLLQLTRLLSEKADPLILTRFLGASSLALYTPGQIICGRIRPIVMVLSDQLYPVTTGFEAEGKAHEMKQVLYLGTRFTFGVAVGVFAALGIFSQSICRVWLEGVLGDDYVIAGYILFAWALIDLAGAASGAQWSVLIAKNKIKLLALTQVVLAVVNLSLSIWLVKNTDLGVLGVIIPTVIINVLRRSYVSYYVSYVSEIPFKEFLSHCYLRPALIALFLFPVTYLIHSSFHMETLFELVVGLFPVAVSFVLLFVFIGITRYERAFLRQRVTLMISRKLKFK
jgi:O-antigen/teichoic acid export membrane protein